MTYLFSFYQNQFKKKIKDLITQLELDINKREHHSKFAVSLKDG